MLMRRLVGVLAGTAGLAGMTAGTVYVTRPDLLVAAVVKYVFCSAFRYRSL